MNMHISQRRRQDRPLVRVSPLMDDRSSVLGIASPAFKPSCLRGNGCETAQVWILDRADSTASARSSC